MGDLLFSEGKQRGTESRGEGLLGEGLEGGEGGETVVRSII